MVGMSGKDGTRSFVVTATPRSVPARMNSDAEGRLSNMIGTWPATTSFRAGPEPL
jgi:hypothetical protein